MRRTAGRLAFALLLALAAWGIFAPAAGAQTILVPAAADTYLRQSNANKNQGQEAVLHVQQSGHNRALVRMDQAAIAAAVGSGSLASATLELYVTDSGGWGSDGRTIDLNRLTASWTENGATWNCADDTLPTNSAANCATQWGGGTFEAEASDSVLHTNTTSGYVQFNVTEDVRAFLAGTPNDGWLAKLTDETVGGNVDYVSRQGASGQAPRLVLVVESPAFDQVPPSLAITSPVHSVLINETRPQIGLSYSDGGSGVNLSSLAVQVDGVAAVCTPAATSATCLPALLAEGSHTITVSLRDQAGNQATASRGFTLLIGPGRRSATFTAVGDTYLRQGNANQTFGGETTLRLRQTGKNRSLARFDTAEIRQSVGQGTLETASLELTIAKNGKNWSKTGRLVDVHRLTADWTEAGATWNCGIDTQPTNNQADCSPQWAGGSFQPTPTASVLHTSSLAGTVSFDVTADVASLLAGTPDYGWLVKKREEDRSGQVDYASREAGAATAPRLVVVFDVPTGPGDTTPPTLAITAPAGTIYNNSTPQIGIQYSDAGSGVDPATLIVQVDGVAVPGCQAGAASATCVAPQLAAGPHTLAAEVRDRAGNRATTSGGFELVVDRDPPQVAIEAPLDPILYNVDIPEIHIRFSDAPAGVADDGVTVSVDGAVAVCSLTPPTALCRPASLAAGTHTIAVTVTDRAGNHTALSRNFDLFLDDEPPAVQILSPATGSYTAGAVPDLTLRATDEGTGIAADGWHVFVDGGEITSTCTFDGATGTCPLSGLGEGTHLIAAEVQDRAGNSAAANTELTVQADHEGPDLRIVAPAAGAVVEGTTVEIRTEYSDLLSGVDPASFQLRLDDQEVTAACQVQAAAATCPIAAVAAGQHTLAATVRDVEGNATEAFSSFEVRTSLALSIDSPAQGTVTRETAVTLRGPVSPSAISVKVGETVATVSGGTWEADAVPVREGSNALTVVARSAAGGVGTETLIVIRDTEPPEVAILSPRDGFVTTSAQVVVTGDLVDSASSSVVQQPLTVRVNDQVPTISRKSFVLPDLLLVPGNNRIEVTAEDAAGNVGRSAVTVRFVPDAAAKIEKISGDFQEAPVGGTLGEPLLVRVVDSVGRPLAGRTVDFAVTRGDGALISFPDAARKLSVTTGADGFATVQFAVGARAGAGNQEVTVSSLGIPGAVAFCASARTKPVKRLVPLVGTDFQGARSSAAGQALPKPLLVQAFDEAGNPVPGVMVTYRAVAGGGGFAGAAELPLATDEEGKAAATFTLGPGEGIDNNRVEVTFDGDTEPPVTFRISGMVPGPAEATSISGVVLDPQDDPVPGAVISVGTLATRSDAEGRFHLAAVPVGTIHLAIDGTTVTRPGTWPHLAYETVTVSGRDNNLGKPLRLPQLDDAGKVWVGGDQDVVVPMRGVAGAFLTVFAHSATFPDGSHEGWMSFTQVPTFKVPMTAPMGSNFQLAWTLQTPGVLFNPPARVTLPNFGGGSGGGYPPGSTQELFSFDHDLEEFVSAGTASISEDGRQLVSNPGMGIAKAGWGGAPPPPPPPGAACGPGSNTSCSACVQGVRLVNRCGPCETCGPLGCNPKLIGLVQVSANLRITRLLIPEGKPVLFAAQAIGLCESYDYEWFFGDGGTLKQRTPTHAYPQKGQFKPEVFATCHECASISKNGTMDVGVFKTQILPQTNDPTITAEPKLTLTPSIKLDGPVPDPTDDYTFFWKFRFELESSRCSNAGRAPTGPYDTMEYENRGAHFLRDIEPIRGGTLSYYVRGSVDGSEVMEKKEKEQYVLATNPQRSAIQALLAAGATPEKAEVLKKLACQESGQMQFRGTANGGTSECPIITFDGGVGIMQLTPPPSADAVWNWKANVDAGKSLFNQKEGSARNFPSVVRGSTGFHAAVAAYNAQVRAPAHLPPLQINVPEYTAEQLAHDTLRGFNGYVDHTGQFNLFWHEYRLAMNAAGLLIVVNINEHDHTGDAVWEVVPTAARPSCASCGDPDYVNNVLNRDPACGG